jgi:hypothetical protein
MIKVRYWENTDGNKKTYFIDAVADTQAEVDSAELDDYVGLPKDAEGLELCSSIMTTEGHMAFMQSNGIWNWVA